MILLALKQCCCCCSFHGVFEATFIFSCLVSSVACRKYFFVNKSNINSINFNFCINFYFIFLRIIWQITNKFFVWFFFSIGLLMPISIFLSLYLYIYLSVRFETHLLNSNEIQIKFKIFGYETSFLVQFYCLTNFDNHLIYGFRMLWWWRSRVSIWEYTTYQFYTFNIFFGHATHTHLHNIGIFLFVFLFLVNIMPKC